VEIFFAQVDHVLSVTRSIDLRDRAKSNSITPSMPNETSLRTHLRAAHLRLAIIANAHAYLIAPNFIDDDSALIYRLKCAPCCAALEIADIDL
jgi:hypothetical protein